MKNKTSIQNDAGQNRGKRRHCQNMISSVPDSGWSMVQQYSDIFWRLYADQPESNSITLEKIIIGLPFLHYF